MVVMAARIVSGANESDEPLAAILFDVRRQHREGQSAWVDVQVRGLRRGAAMLLEMRGAPAVALTGVGAQKNESGRRGTNDVEQIGPLAGVW